MFLKNQNLRDMKNIIFAALMAMGILLAGESFAQESVKVTKSTFQEIELEITTGQLSFEEVVMGGQHFTNILLPNSVPSMNEGEPQLPVFSQLLEIPLQYESYRESVLEEVWDTIRLTEKGFLNPILPAQPSRSKSDTSSRILVMNSSVYQLNGFYSPDYSSTHLDCQVGVARDRRLARLHFSPVWYNPQTHELLVCKWVKLRYTFQNVDEAESERLYELHHNPFFGGEIPVINHLPHKSVTSAPVRYLIVCHSSFNGQLDSLVAWKQQKGFLTDIVYTNNPAVGTTTTSIANYIKSQYTNATPQNPAPTYVLLVGDVAQIPVFTGTTDAGHVSDLYYFTWTTGDNLPDCYYGRFSAQNTSQLTPQVDKTLMYEKYTFADPSFLDRAVLVAGVDGGNAGDWGYTHADPAMDYAATHYINGTQGFTQVKYFKNNTSINPNALNVTLGSNSSSNSATVRGFYNQGAGWINYSAHGSASSWGTPNFTTSHISSMTNNQKFGIMIGNCCLTQKFEESECFGEALLRKGNYCGAVGYIGGSNSTYWGEDFYWAVGLRSSIGPSMSMAYNAAHLGVYDRLCHTHNESYPNRYMTQGSMIMAGNMAVESSTSSLKLYYWEIYHLMGDPSLMPWLTQADTMQIVAPDVVLAGGIVPLSVHSVPYAYVAVTNSSHQLICAAFSDSLGNAILTPPSGWELGAYQIAATAQQYRTRFKPLNVIAPNGPYVSVTALRNDNSLNVGDTVTLTTTLSNVGNQTADSIRVEVISNNPLVEILGGETHYSNLASGDTAALEHCFQVKLNRGVEDMETVTFEVVANWDESEYTSHYFSTKSIHAPKVVVEWTSTPEVILPGSSAVLHAHVQNQGHMNLENARLSLSQPFFLAVELNAHDTIVSIPAGGSLNLNYSISLSSQMPVDVMLPISMQMGNQLYSMNHQENIFVGEASFLNLESNPFSEGWTTDPATPWTWSSDEHHSGSKSLKSGSISHNGNTSVEFSWTSSRNDTVSFWRKVSSETNYDWLHFYIDNTEKGKWSGNASWEQISYPVEAGTHTYKFTYSKDGSVSSGSDCAWIDDIRLPLRSNTIHFQIDTVCPGTEYSFQGETVNTLEEGNGFAFVPAGNYQVNFLAYQVAPAHERDTLVKESCDFYNWNGMFLTTTGFYEKQLTDMWGCDSILALSLTIHNSTVDTVEVEAVNSCLFGNTTLTQSGWYTHTFQSQAGCDSLVFLNLTVEYVGIANADSIQVKLFPNPATDRVEILSAEPLQKVEVLNLSGQVVLSQETLHNSLSLEMLPNGIYFVRILTSSHQSHTFKLIKQ